MLIGSTLKKIWEQNRGDGGTTRLGQHICHTAQYLCGRLICIEVFVYGVAPFHAARSNPAGLGLCFCGRMQALKKMICILSRNTSRGHCRGNYFILFLYTAPEVRNLCESEMMEPVK